MGQSRGAAATAGGMLLLFLLLVAAEATTTTRVPAMFVFGDSLVDAGNNDAFPGALARADYYPYGVDLGAATGRFCNGKTVADALCDLLGLRYVPAYTSTRGLNGTAAEMQVLGGVNYAAAAGGILDETGQHLGERFSLSQQVLNLEATLDGVIRPLFGGDQGGYERHLARSVAVLVVGGNDYLNNYLLTPLGIGYDAGDRYSPGEYADHLLDHYARQILALHSLGLRKFLLAGVGPLGCTPGLRALAVKGPRPRAGECVEQVNQMVGLFNQGLRSLVDQLNADHRPVATFIYGNTYAAVQEMIHNPGKYGFTVVDSGCCGVVAQIITGGGLCLPLVAPCGERERYVFWDAYHPTQATNVVLAKMAFDGTPEHVYPLNFRQLAEL